MKFAYYWSGVRFKPWRHNSFSLSKSRASFGAPVRNALGIGSLQGSGWAKIAFQNRGLENSGCKDAKMAGGAGWLTLAGRGLSRSYL